MHANRKYWYVLAASIVVLAGLTPLAWHGSVPAWEAQLFAQINGAQLPSIFTKIASLASDLTWVIVFAALAVFLFWRGKRNLGWNAGFLAGSAYAATWLFEHVVQRARPVGLDAVSDDAVIRASQDGYGFTSGHVAVLTAVVLWVWLRANTWQRVLLGILVLLEMWARVFLGVHMPLDVVGGAAMALAVWAALQLLPAKLRSRLHLKRLPSEA